MGDQGTALASANGTAVGEVRSGAMSAAVDMGGSMVPLEQAIEIASRLEGAVTLPQHFRSAPDLTAAVLTAMQWRVPLMAVIRGCHMIEGRISPSADLMVGIAMGSGLVADWVEEELTDPPGCRVTVTLKDGRTVESQFDLDDAKQAELLGRANWKRYPRDMCRARAVSRAAARACPQTFAGIYSEEELAPQPAADFRRVDTDTGEIVDSDRYAQQPARQDAPDPEAQARYEASWALADELIEQFGEVLTLDDKADYAAALKAAKAAVKDGKIHPDHQGELADARDAAQQRLRDAQADADEPQFDEPVAAEAVPGDDPWGDKRAQGGEA